MGCHCLLQCMKVKSLSRIRLCAPPRTVARQDPSCMECSRQEYWSGLPCPSPGDLPDPGIEPGSPVLQADCLPSEPPGRPSCCGPVAGKCSWPVAVCRGQASAGVELTPCQLGKCPFSVAPSRPGLHHTLYLTSPHPSPGSWEELPGYALTSEPPPLFSELLQSLLPLCKLFIFSKFPQTASV